MSRSRLATKRRDVGDLIAAICNSVGRKGAILPLYISSVALAVERPTHEGAIECCIMQFVLYLLTEWHAGGYLETFRYWWGGKLSTWLLTSMAKWRPGNVGGFKWSGKVVVQIRWNKVFKNAAILQSTTVCAVSILLLLQFLFFRNIDMMTSVPDPDPDASAKLIVEKLRKLRIRSTCVHG